jgi:predicted transcriptional regulator
MLRVPESLYLELEEVAQANDRPITWEGLRALRKHVKAEKARIKAGEPDQPGDA